MCAPKILIVIISSKTLLFLPTGCCPLVWTVLTVLKCSLVSLNLKVFFWVFFHDNIIPTSSASHVQRCGTHPPPWQENSPSPQAGPATGCHHHHRHCQQIMVMVVIIIAILIINKISQHPWQEHSGGKHHHRQHLCHCHHNILDIMITSSLSLS